MIYVTSMVIITLFLIGFLTIKNQCSKLKNEIVELQKSTIKNTSIVKELQSRREFFSSEQYISEMVKDIMVAVAPEPEIINLKEE